MLSPKSLSWPGLPIPRAAHRDYRGLGVLQVQQKGCQTADNLLQEDILAVPTAGLVEVPKEADGRRAELHPFLGNSGCHVALPAKLPR